VTGVFQVSENMRFRAISALCVMVSLAACSGAPRLQTALPADQQYNIGLDALHKKDYKTAVAQFDSLEQTTTYSPVIADAMLMHGYAEYQRNHYADAITQFDSFIQLHPANRSIAYVYYLRAISYYEQILDIKRDQTKTQEAMTALQEVVNRFPTSSYGRDAKSKIVVCLNHLAGKEMVIGRWYEQQKLYAAAINRFQHVVQDYKTTNYMPEALHRLTEVYLKLGMVNEAKRTTDVLAKTYHDSPWYRDSQKALLIVG
jgi:outer membrane protein assembly factor BamD